MLIDRAEGRENRKRSECLQNTPPAIRMEMSPLKDMYEYPFICQTAPQNQQQNQQIKPVWNTTPPKAKQSEVYIRELSHSPDRRNTESKDLDAPSPE